jgi:hypothetical protein
MRFTGVMALVWLVSAAALAEEPLVPEATAELVVPPGARIERPFLYMNDPSLPEPGQTVLQAATAFASASGALRPLGAPGQGAGLVQGFTLEHGVTSWLAPIVSGLLSEPLQPGGLAAAFQLGARLRLTRLSSPLHLTLQASALREFDGTLGVFGELSGRCDLGRLQLGASAHAEKVFAHDRDTVDLDVVTGLTYLVATAVRVGLEYVIQDAEELAYLGAEGGAHQFLGPDVSWEVADRFLVTAGPAVELGSSPLFLGRLTATYSF